jgi:2-amino-4-hydroxy-6-hydroxymethyldihydropteridine diphosphokinase
VTGRRVRAYIGLGANVGDAAGALAWAVAALDDLPHGRLRGVSRLYATVPVGVIDQPEFRNAAVALDAPASANPATGALALLSALKRLEREFGRRPRKRWGPRELDLDLLVFGRVRLTVERTPDARSLDAGPPDGASDPDAATSLLVVPHPAADARLFVLAPLADLAPGLVPPGWGRSVETARRQRLVAEGSDAVRPVATWDQAARSWRPIQPR